MKKTKIALLGIATVLSAGAADAATATKIASQAYVDTTVGNVATAVDSALANKADTSTVTALDGRVTTNTQSINEISGTIGTEALTTTAQTIAGAINEIKNSVPTNESFTEMQNTLNGKQDALSEAQMNAVNSGITSAQVAQIGTNATNISTLTTTVAGKANSATTLAGYGITDAYTQTQINDMFDGTIPQPSEGCAAASGRCVLTVNNAGTGLMWMDITPDTVTEPTEPVTPPTGE